MKNHIWKVLGAMLVGLPVGLYTAFVAECFWNWFAVPALHLPEISFLQWLGLWWLIGLFVRPSSSSENDKRWTLSMSVLELCVPEGKQAALKELLEANPILTFLEAFSMIFGQVVGNTITLVLGFLLHLLIP